MSLFGQPAKPAGSLFGSTLGGASTPGNATAQQPSTGGGLFGGATNNNTSTPGVSSLFGQSPQQPAAQQQQPQASSLFGGAQQTNTQQSSNPFGGLGGQQAQPQQANSSLFGGAQQQQPQQATSSLFGGAQPQQQQQQQQQQPGASISANGLPQGNTTGYFDSLLAKSKKQANGESPLEDLPSLHLGMGDLRQRLRQLGARTTDPAQAGKGQYMLAASGVDPGSAVKDLNYFHAHTGARVERSVGGTGPTAIDVDAYLANLQTKTTLNMIADGLERSARDFDNFLEDNITSEWEAQRMRIYEHFGIKSVQDGPGASTADPSAKGGFGTSRRTARTGRASTNGAKGSTFGRSTLQKSVIGTPSKIGSHPEFGDVKEQNGGGTNLGSASVTDDRFLREKQSKLSERVRQLNLARVEKAPYPILHELAHVESTSGDRHAQHMVDAYQAVIAMVGENAEAETFAGGATAKERAFREMYLDVNSKSANAGNMRKTILSGANKFLEHKFYENVEDLITKYPKEANLGGRPDVISKMKAYVRLRHVRKDLVPDGAELQQVEGEYIWALVFYLLRSGHVDEAAEYVKTRANTFRAIDRTFSSYLLEYAASPDRRLRRQLQERCNNEYSQRSRMAPTNSIDPYRMACYKIVGRCEVSNRSLDGLKTDIDDWIWLQFNLARENERTIEVASESYTLLDLQNSIQEIGNKHFPKTPSEDTNGTFGMFFFMQVLAGMFEKAIGYLYAFSYVDAIHFAIGLEFYGLLRPADPWSAATDLVSFDTRGNRQISFGRMLGYYTRDFRAADVKSAVDYLVLICLNADLEGEAGTQQAELCHAALRELVLETREFSKLIGDIRPDGQRIHGLIQERAQLIHLQAGDDFVRTVTQQAARFADENGRTTDAVLLYHLAGDYDSVVTIVSRALSEAISQDIGEDPMRLMPVKPRADGKTPGAQPGSSLSLASIDDPVQLAQTMLSIYEADAMFYTKVEDQNRISCHMLLEMSVIKKMVEAGQWSESIDKIQKLEILPIEAQGDANKIRNAASRFAGLSQPVAANVPNLLLWTITCCVREREKLASGQFSGNDGTVRMVILKLRQLSMDLTTYTSQLKYRFPPHIHEALARASAD
ncbi:Nucleoporin NIC96 [Microdochium nivale]|nr:Nucleoporin NIC96 [Microdochium nivale]